MIIKPTIIMKLHLKDQNKTVLTTKGKLLLKDYTFASANNGYDHSMDVQFGDTIVKLKYSDDRHLNKDWNKLIKWGFERPDWKPYITDEDRGMAAWKPYHGEECYSVLDDRGTGGIFVWDTVKKTVVNKNQLTQL